MEYIATLPVISYNRVWGPDPTIVVERPQGDKLWRRHKKANRKLSRSAKRNMRG